MPKPILFGFYAEVNDDFRFIRCRASGYVHDQIIRTTDLIRILARRGAPA